MSNIPAHLQYTSEHEWILVEDNIAKIGITYHAQEALGDLVFVELPELGAKMTKDDSCVVVESVKAASEVYAPLSGEIVEVNEALDSTPEIINDDPYDKGWLLKIKLSNSEELSDLLSPSDYKTLTE